MPNAIMYVYQKNLITDRYDVGFFAPDGKWHNVENASYLNPAHAALKVHYLNGGAVNDRWARLMLIFNEWCLTLSELKKEGV